MPCGLPYDRSAPVGAVFDQRDGRAAFAGLRRATGRVRALARRLRRGRRAQPDGARAVEHPQVVPRGAAERRADGADRRSRPVIRRDSRPAVAGHRSSRRSAAGAPTVHTRASTPGRPAAPRPAGRRNGGPAVPRRSPSTARSPSSWSPAWRPMPSPSDRLPVTGACSSVARSRSCPSRPTPPQRRPRSQPSPRCRAMPVDLIAGGWPLLLIEVEQIEPELWFDLAPRGDCAGRARAQRPLKLAARRSMNEAMPSGSRPWLAPPRSSPGSRDRRRLVHVERGAALAMVWLRVAHAAIWAATANARSTCWPGSTTSWTSPMRWASAAVNSSAVSRWYWRCPNRRAGRGGSSPRRQRRPPGLELAKVSTRRTCRRPAGSRCRCERDALHGRHRRLGETPTEAERIDRPGPSGVLRSASGPKKAACRAPLVCSPANVNTPTQRSGSSSRRVIAAASSPVIWGEGSSSRRGRRSCAARDRRRPASAPGRAGGGRRRREWVPSCNGPYQSVAGRNALRCRA